MLSLTQNVLIIILTMGVSLLFMVGLNRLWPVQKRTRKTILLGRGQAPLVLLTCNGGPTQQWAVH
jgi:hypothetical protein